MPNLADHVLHNPPRCIAEVDKTPMGPIERDRCDVVATFSIAQRETGAATANILGYPLSEYNPSCKGEVDFISPITLHWPDGKQIVVFDSQIHGYHGEMNASAKLRGKGPSKMFACPQCGGETFSISMQFDYWGACNDLWEDEPDLPIQDYFCNVILSGRCDKCRTVKRVLDMDL